MNDENALLIVFIIAVTIAFTLAVGGNNYNEREITKAAIAAGLQQCTDPHTYRTIWQKECSK